MHLLLLKILTNETTFEFNMLYYTLIRKSKDLNVFLGGGHDFVYFYGSYQSKIMA